MKKMMYIPILLILTIPMLVMFTNSTMGLIIGFVWGYMGWAIVLGQYDESKYSIRNDTLLQQHNKEAEEIEQQEEQDPRQIVKEAMENTEEQKPRSPFG